jgi:hypothetical protein
MLRVVSQAYIELQPLAMLIGDENYMDDKTNDISVPSRLKKLLDKLFAFFKFSKK